VKSPLTSSFEEVDLNREIFRIAQARESLFNLPIETLVYCLLDLTRGNHEPRSMSLLVCNRQTAALAAFRKTISL
jgi:hypothetical protein